MMHVRTYNGRMRTEGSLLAYGVHLGKSELRRELPGFSASVLQPTLHEEDVPLHTHDSASLIFVLEGTYRTSADCRQKLSSEPRLIFNPSGTVHRDSFVTPKGRFLALSVAKKLNGSVGSEGQLPKAALSFVSGHAIAMAKHLLRELECNTPHNSVILEDACWETIAAVSGAARSQGRSPATIPPWLSEARSMLTEGSETGSIASIASQLGLHPVYLARRFRRHFGCSPAEYRMRCRLRTAIEGLRQSESSLGQIAQESGFFDQSHFTHAFKERFGHSPGVYRSRLKPSN